MARKHTRPPDTRAYSAQTGDNYYDAEEETVASDVPIPSRSTEAAQVGRTPFDLLHESGSSKALSRFLQETDPVELMFIIAYVVLSGWGGSQHPVWPFSYFGVSLVAYHIIGRPLASGLTHWTRTWGKRPVD